MDNRANVSAQDLALVQQLKARRERLEMSQTEVAHAMSADGVRMSQTAISRAEKGERALTVGEAQLYATVLHTSLNELLSADEVDELAADCRATLRAMEISRTTALRALHEHHRQIKALRHIEASASALWEQETLSKDQREKLEKQLFTPLRDAHHLHDEEAKQRLSQALEALEATGVNEDALHTSRNNEV